ncbi:nicotinamidase-related amidase [Paenibacillus rhizosphaerae]|uniref:Nicotinamidase-related amidase n=1 Tax=Paenibacillus rhizosphaerae TaxID=297318 RepID=A0A839TZC0_9BACL|nr:cysteine hydrolase [Paenibacillus rhizosphaerae]MBB3130569.1 nicotinamidase-related amidase [Paenibacillus rhizosphaerae]
MQNPESRSALLVMDMQNSIVPRYANDEKALQPFQTAIEAARSHEIPVIYVRVAFRPGYPEISPRNKLFGGMPSRTGSAPMEGMMEIHESVKPRPDEPVVTKVRVSAFAGSDLEVILRANRIDTLILSGIATSGVVLSTLREAADKDFALVVLSDACIDADPEVHRVLTEKVFPKQADVLTAEEWVKSLE